MVILHNEITESLDGLTNEEWIFGLPDTANSIKDLCLAMYRMRTRATQHSKWELVKEWSHNKGQSLGSEILPEPPPVPAGLQEKAVHEMCEVKKRINEAMNNPSAFLPEKFKS